MKKYTFLLLTTSIFGLCTSPSFAFNPDKYTYTEKLISVDGEDMVVLRIYDEGQTVKFSKEDLNADEDEETEIDRSFNNQDLSNAQIAMRYVKDVFGVPTEAPVIETLTDTEDNAAFDSPVSSATGGLWGTRLSTWFTNQEKSTQLPIGFLEIGEMGDKDDDTLYPLVNKGEGGAMSSVLVHEMMHGMGIATEVDGTKDSAGKMHFSAPDANSIFSGHLYDIYDHQLQAGMKLEKGPVETPDANTFYQYNNGGQSGAYFWGDNVKDVLTVQGQTTEIALPDDEMSGLTVKGIPVNGYEDTYDDEKKIVEIPELSHLELQNSMMSHQNYRNWGIFMEAELAVLQDIGFTNIDRRRFFGFSVYNSGLTYTNTDGFDSSQDCGVGLHIYGSNNIVTQGADIEIRGENAYGIRIDGQENMLVIPDDTEILAEGRGNIGILVSYGNSHILNIQGDVEATGSGGYALRFDFGGNLLGDQEEYRGSYFQVHKDEKTEQWVDYDEDGIVDALDGPLAGQVDISGNLVGQAAAVYISDNALVRQINVLDGASITGDIVSEWSSRGNRYGNYGKGMTLYKPADEVDRTLLTFGFAADEEGQATDYADPNFEMTYDGNILGADGFDVQLAGGKLTYGGIADINILQTEEDTELLLADAGVYATTIAGNGTVSTQGSSSITVKGSKGLAQFNELTVEEGSDLEINADRGIVEIGTLENAGNTGFKSNKVQKGQIAIDTYAGTEDSVLSLDLDDNLANQLSGSTTAQTVQQGAQIITIDNNTTSSVLNLHIAEGDVNGEINAVIDAEGKVVAASEKENSTMATLKEIYANGFQVFRAQMNDLEKRMGDLRNMPSERGAWAKIIAGKGKYKSIRSDYKTAQFGIDQQIEDFFGGITFSYTKGDGDLQHGSTDDKNYAFGLYGGWLGKDGQFVDLTLKHHRLDSDYDFTVNNKYSEGSYKRSGNSASVEYGWRLGIGETNYYVEPQTEFLYGYLNSADFTASNGVKVKQSAVKSAIGRLGMAIGWTAPCRKGNVYVKASVLNDWDGDSKICTSKGNASRCYHEDLGGTWGAFALGGTWNINNNWSAYGEMETTTGSPVRTIYEFNAGLRLNF